MVFAIVSSQVSPRTGPDMAEQTSTPNYVVIIPHYNDVMRLERCLTALAPQLGDDVDVVVADNNSTVDLEPIKAQFPDVRFVIQTEKGAGPARNMGVSVTTAPWIFFIDADCVPAPDWIEVGKRIKKDRHIIGGPVPVFHETPAPQSGAEAFETVFAFKMQAYLERDAFLGAGNLILPRTVFDDMDGFRAAVAEDKEWSQRAARNGYTLAFDTGFIASHPSRQNWAALRRPRKTARCRDAHPVAAMSHGMDVVSGCNEQSLIEIPNVKRAVRYV